MRNSGGLECRNRYRSQLREEIMRPQSETGMISERSVLRVVESIYAAAEDAQLWNDVLSQLNELFRTTHSALFLQDNRRRAATMAAYIWNPDSISAYAAHSARVNPLL